MRKRSSYRPLDLDPSMVAEQWRHVVGSEGLYSISNYGRLRSESRNVPGKLGSTRHIKCILRQPTPDSSGYLQASLQVGGARRNVKIATLVAEAFIGPRPDGYQVCHNDGVRTNNVAWNLRYDTPTGNAADKVKHGTTTRGERAGKCAKLTRDQAELARTDPRSCRAIAREFGVHHSTVSLIKRGVAWI